MNGEGEGRSLRLAEFAGSVPEWLRLGQWSQQTREEVSTLHDYSGHQFVFFFFLGFQIRQIIQCYSVGLW